MMAALLGRGRGAPATARALRHGLRRFTTASDGGAELPAVVQRALQGGLLVVRQTVGAGRGLFAAQGLHQGQVVHEEAPYLAAASPAHRDKVCHHCLQVIQPEAAAAAAAAAAVAAPAASTSSSGTDSEGAGDRQRAVRCGGHLFCSRGCQREASGSYHAAEARMDLRLLASHCARHGERFPMLAARLAAMQLQAADAAGAAAGAPGGAAAAAAAAGEGCPAPRGRSPLLGELGFLCFANVPEPAPEPWQQAHQLLQQGIGTLLASSDAAGRARMQPTAAALDLGWYVQVMSRLHINCFKVDAILPFDWQQLSLAAAAAVAGGQDGTSGSAAYVLASLFNHSCCPNLDVSFPYQDGTAVFTAARDVEAGEQLTISYIDSHLPLAERRAALEFGYGFTCGCEACREEAAGGDGGDGGAG